MSGTDIDLRVRDGRPRDMRVRHRTLTWAFKNGRPRDTRETCTTLVVNVGASTSARARPHRERCTHAERVCSSGVLV